MYYLDSDEDLFNLFNNILKKINKKRMLEVDQDYKQNERVEI
jgi:hypothetical protein